MTRIINSYRFGAAAVTENLFIGGVSGTITTAALLAAKFSFIEGEVVSFAIDGANIKAEISNTNYTTQGASFASDTDITSIKETAGYLTQVDTNSFNAASNLVLVDLIGCTDCLLQAFFNCSNLSAGNILLPALTTLSASTNCFWGLKVDTSTLSFPLLTNVTGAFVFRFARYNCDFPELLTVTLNSAWDGNVGNFIDIPKCIQLGPTTADDANFHQSTSSIIRTNVFLQTAQGGGVEGDLVDAISHGSTVVYDTGAKPDDITDLAVGTVYTDGVDLTWSVPTSTHPIIFYEIYVDGIFNNKVFTNSGRAIGLTNLSNVDLTVKTVDDTYSKGGSNTVNQTINGSVSWVDSLINAYWRLNNDATDEKGLHDGTETAITYGAGKSGQAAIFNGSTSQILVSDSNDFSFVSGSVDQPFSLSFYVKFDLANNSAIIIGKEDTSFREWAFLQDGNNKLNFRLWKEGGTSARIGVDAALTITTSQFYYIVATYDGSEIEAGMQIYIDGVIATSGSDSSGTYTNMNNTSSDVYIGKFPTITSFTHDGDLDGLAVWNVELNEHEVGVIFNKQDGGEELL